MEKLSEALGAYLPAWSVGPLVAIAVVILGWFIATIAKIIVAGAINRTGLGRKAQTVGGCLLYTSPSPRDQRGSRMPSSA